MVLKTLSITERQILANQFKILSKLEDDNEFYERKVEILEEGYTGQYREIFVVSEKEISYDICIKLMIFLLCLEVFQTQFLF
mgnify:CR=1 FL=1